VAVLADATWLDELAGAIFARPKSRILAWPRLVTKMLAGLMSRWTMPWECAAVKGVGDLNAERQERLKVQWPKRGHVLQRLAVEKFHGDEGFAILLADVVDGANVGMVQAEAACASR